VEAFIRKADPRDIPAIAKVHVDTWQTAYKGIVASEFLASLSYQESERIWQSDFSASPNPLSVYVAECHDRTVVGFAGAGPEREGDPTYKGEIYAIYLLQPYQRQGIGTALFTACAQELDRLGFTSFLIWVLKSNPASRFYEALGGIFLREKEIQIGTERLLEVAYGWTSVDC
jgi:ribosomal protein S18 acetylase RimI-like enzyme